MFPGIGAEMGNVRRTEHTYKEIEQVDSYLAHQLLVLKSEHIENRLRRILLLLLNRLSLCTISYNLNEPWHKVGFASKANDVVFWLGGGPVVSVHAFYSGDLSSNNVEVKWQFFTKVFFEKKNTNLEKSGLDYILKALLIFKTHIFLVIETYTK